jgi:hypothetical protein
MRDLNHASYGGAVITWCMYLLDVGSLNATVFRMQSTVPGCSMSLTLYSRMTPPVSRAGMCLFGVGCVPGGPDTAMMYSIFRQSQAQVYSAHSGKLRARIAHSNEQTGDLVCQIREDVIKKTVTLETFVSQLRDVVQLSSARTMYAMSEEDIAEKNRLTNDVLMNFEQQLRINYKAYERERQQNVLIAKLNYEQQLHIHDVNKECLNISNQRKEIVEKEMGLDVKVSQIKDTLKELQGKQPGTTMPKLTQVLSPLDTTTIMETLVKLRDALKDATCQNAYSVMQNNELYLHNSCMTPAQKAAIKKAQAEQTTIYRQQRENRHCIIAVGLKRVGPLLLLGSSSAALWAA